jgi:WW domain-binding protein 11
VTSDSSDVSSEGSIEGIETEEEVPMPESEKVEENKKEITESDDEYEIPLPPGPPPPKPFASQVPNQGRMLQQLPPPPPPLSHQSMPYYYHPQPQPYYSHYQQAQPPTTYSSLPVHYEATIKEPKKPVVTTISAEPQLRDLQKELLGFVPAAVRRKQAKKNN